MGTLANSEDPDEMPQRKKYNIFENYLRNEFKFWNVHGIMNTSGLVQSK